jgi:16S rRNA (uracil1498-N3)-methyltransferase
VSLPLFIVASLPPPGIFVLDGPEGHHAATVQRLRAGERLVVGDGFGRAASAVVATVGKASLTLHIEQHWYVEPSAPRLVVAQGLPKGERGELAVQAMTEAGVDEIVPWAASRCVVEWKGERGARSRDRWESIAREAAKQSRRMWLPVVAPTVAHTPALAARRVSALFVLHEEATEPLSTVALPPDGDIMLVIGPEGGITDAEVETFNAAGGTPVRLGSTVLRTSSAGLAALSVLSARLGRW